MNRQLVGLGGLAIVLVVLHHTIDLEIAWFQAQGVALAQDWRLFALVSLHRLGKVAVPLFLFISGGFIAYAARGVPPRLSRHSVTAALRRLLWPYLIWSLIFYAMVYLQRQESYSALGYLKNLAVGYPFHFVPLLIFFYAISPWLVHFARRYGLAMILAIAVAQTLLVAVEFPGALPLLPSSWRFYLSIPVLGHTLALWGIYFPLGLIMALNSKTIQPWLYRTRWLLATITVAGYVLDVLHTARIAHFPWAVFIYPLSFVLLTPLIQRQWIPWIAGHEYVGKRSYGLYLTHLLVVNLSLLAVAELAPWLFDYPLLLIAPIFALALAVPLLVMRLLASGHARITYRYVFG